MTHPSFSIRPYAEQTVNLIDGTYEVSCQKVKAASCRLRHKQGRSRPETDIGDDMASPCPTSNGDFVRVLGMTTALTLRMAPGPDAD